MADQDSLEDYQLLQRISEKDRTALDVLYSRYMTPVFSLAMYMLKQQSLAEEVTQDVFLNIWLKAASFRPERGQARSWIMSVAHHKIVDVIRSRRRAFATTNTDASDLLSQYPAGGPSTEEHVERKLDRERIQRAMQELPPNQREVIELAYFEGYSQSEMAQRLNQPLGTVKTRVRLAMQKLRLALQEHDD